MIEYLRRYVHNRSVKKQRLAISIDEKRLIAPDINNIYFEAMQYIDFNKLRQVQNDINTIIEILIR